MGAPNNVEHSLNIIKVRILSSVPSFLSSRFSLYFLPPTSYLLILAEASNATTSSSIDRFDVPVTGAPCS